MDADGTVFLSVSGDAVRHHHVRHEEGVDVRLLLQSVGLAKAIAELAGDHRREGFDVDILRHGELSDRLAFGQRCGICWRRGQQFEQHAGDQAYHRLGVSSTVAGAGGEYASNSECPGACCCRWAPGELGGRADVCPADAPVRADGGIGWTIAV